MKALFVELPSFARNRENYLDDENFLELQNLLMSNPEAGDMIESTGGLRKVRFADAKRRKGKRGGIRVIYYWWAAGLQFWLFTLYNKDEVSDLTPANKKSLREMIKQELDLRSKT